MFDTVLQGLRHLRWCCRSSCAGVDPGFRLRPKVWHGLQYHSLETRRRQRLPDHRSRKGNGPRYQWLADKGIGETEPQGFRAVR